MIYDFLNTKRNEVLEVYLTQIFYGVGMSMIGLFIPIYLLQIGFTLNQVLFYVLIERVAQMVASPFAARFAGKIGLKRTTWLRIPFFVGQFMWLYCLTQYQIPYLVPAILGGIATTMYWIPLHTLFARYSHGKKRGSEVGVLESVPMMFRIIAPALAGIIASVFGFPTLIIVALAIVSLSTIPLFLTKEMQTHQEFKWKDLFAVRQHKFVSAIMAEGFADNAASILFPVLIYLALESTESVGYIKTLGVLVAALASYAVGKKIDKANKMKWLAHGGVLFGLTIAIRPFLSTAAGFSAAILFGAMTWSIYNTSLKTIMYQLASDLKEKADEFIVAREIYLNIGRVIALGFCIMLPWKVGFFLAAIALTLSAWILRSDTVSPFHHTQ